MTKECTYQGQAEGLIAVGRLILIVFSIVSIWHHLDGPTRYPAAAYYLLAGYLCYAIVLALAMWSMSIICANWTMVLYALDLTVFAFFVFLTGGPTGPLYLFSTYFLAGAALRWQLRGAIFTLAIVVAIVLLDTLYPVNLWFYPQFSRVHFIISLVSIALIAVMVGCISRYEQKRRDELIALAAWPLMANDDIANMMQAALEHAAKILGMPRLLAIWEETEEPWLHVAFWTGENVQYTREAPDVFGTVVAEALTGTNFFCRNLTAPKPMVLHTSQSKYEQWQGMPLDPQLRERFSMQSVLSLVLPGKSVEGRLFAFDKPRMYSGDLVVGEIVAHAVANDLDRFYLLQQVQQMAAIEERSCLARDLHDGLLQNLTGVTMQLENVQNLLDGNVQIAQSLIENRGTITAIMRDVRAHINRLKPSPALRPEPKEDFAAHLQEMAGRIRRQWGLQVMLDVKLSGRQLPGGQPAGVPVQDIYYIVHEAMINAARHAQAKSVQVDISTADDQLHITVLDDGKGFCFRGRYDQGELKKMSLGPVTLMERVASLGGSLMIESKETGATLEFVLPMLDKKVK